MIALCVDDEPRLLSALTRAVEAVPQITETAAFTDEQDALDWARSHRPDAAFLDIQLHTMDGLTLARKLRETHPALAVVFCTGYESYAVDALKMHIDAGYLMKPIRAQAVREEVEHILNRRPAARLTAVCFGNFAVYSGAEPVAFPRRRSKELLAYLIDRRGAMISARQLAAELLPELDDSRKTSSIIYQAAHALGEALRAAGAEDVLLSRAGSYGVNPARIDCDYFRALAGDRSAAMTFCVEYMSQYSWAEDTCAWLQKNLERT